MRVAANEKAEAEKIIQIKRAEGEAESKYLSGVGIARQRQAIVDGLRDSVLGFSVNVPGTTAKDVLDMVLITQYFDTMKEIDAAPKPYHCLSLMDLVQFETLQPRSQMICFKHLTTRK